MTEKSFMLFRQADVNYTPLSLSPGQACANCRFFKSYGGEYSMHPECHLVDSWPEAIEATGRCDRWEAAPVPEPLEQPPIPVVIVEVETETETGEAAQGGKSAWQNVMGAFRRLLHRAPDTSSGFKVYGDRWVGWWTNNFEDRDGEFFTEKAIDEYVERVDAGIVPYPQLWYWHVPGTKHGEADWLARIDHYCVAAGTFDDTPAGKAAKAYYSSARDQQSMSHGFTYDVTAKKDKVYHQFNTFELSPLPPRVAANPFTQFEEVKAMGLSPEKQAQLERVFGAQIAASIIADTEAKSKAIEEAGVAYKDFARMDEPTSPAPEAVKAVEAEVKTLISETMRDSAEAVTVVANLVKAFAALQTDSAAKLEQALKIAEESQAEVKALREQMDLRPRSASRASETEIEDTEATKKLKEQLATKHSFTGLLVEE